jgi:hypothetical protein
MKMPVETKPALWGAAGGAIALAIVGFAWGGWVTGGASAQTAKVDSERAVVAVLAPICAAQFMAETDSVAKLTELKAVSSYEQGSFVEKGGWATMPGSKSPVSGVARGCATLLVTAT